MCVVIDADTFSEISNDSNEDFEPLRKWINQKGHRVIHGGSKYAKELSNHSKFLKYLRELERTGNTHALNKQEVDDTQEFLEGNFVLASYNDHHIAAILFVSGCRVVSSHDQGFHRLIEACCRPGGRTIIRQLPELMVNKPKIYQDKSHESILNDRSVSHCCV